MCVRTWCKTAQPMFMTAVAPSCGLWSGLLSMRLPCISGGCPRRPCSFQQHEQRVRWLSSCLVLPVTQLAGRARPLLSRHRSWCALGCTAMLSFPLPWRWLGAARDLMQSRVGRPAHLGGILRHSGRSVERGIICPLCCARGFSLVDGAWA